MRKRQLIVALTLGALVGSGSLLLLGPTGSTANSAQAATRPIVSRSGTLTVRPAGQPASSTPAQQVQSAKATLTVKADRTQATIVLKAAPTPAQDASLGFHVGQVDNGVCTAEYTYSTPTHGPTATGWSRSGTTYTLNTTGSSVYSFYDCAFVTVTDFDDDDYSAPYDALLGSLAAVHAKAKLKIVSAKLLGSTRLQLVPGVWTPIEVTVRNIGEYQAGRVLVTGRGTALSVRQVRTPAAVYDDSSATVTVRVRLNKKRKTALRLMAKGPTAAQVARSFAVTARKAPPRIKDGRYRSKDKRVTFRVKKARIVGFRIYTMTTCGGYPDVLTHTFNYYTIPTTSVPKSGVVTVAQRGTKYTYTARLVGLASGKTLTRAKFTWSGPNRCRASKSFVAHRIGK